MHTLRNSSSENRKDKARLRDLVAGNSQYPRIVRYFEIAPDMSLGENKNLEAKQLCQSRSQISNIFLFYTVKC